MAQPQVNSQLGVNQACYERGLGVGIPSRTNTRGVVRINSYSLIYRSLFSNKESNYITIVPDDET
jgi:hypothetical protein